VSSNCFSVIEFDALNYDGIVANELGIKIVLEVHKSESCGSWSFESSIIRG
jgi:hypothetical protein